MCKKKDERIEDDKTPMATHLGHDIGEAGRDRQRDINLMQHRQHYNKIDGGKHLLVPLRLPFVSNYNIHHGIFLRQQHLHESQESISSFSYQNLIRYRRSAIESPRVIPVI